MKGQSEFVTSYMGPWWTGGREGPGSKPCTISPNFSTAVQSKVYSYPAGCSWLWLSAPRPLCIQQRPYLQWLLSVLKSDNDGVRYPWWWMTQAFFWRWKLVLFSALWGHKLQWRHIRNRLIRLCKGCTFHWCIDCGKYCCLICRGRKLLGWLS